MRGKPKEPVTALRERRESLGLIQVEVADAVGCSHAYVAMWERGEKRCLRPEWRRGIAKLLGRRVAELFDVDGQPILLDGASAPEPSQSNLPDWKQERVLELERTHTMDDIAKKLKTTTYQVYLVRDRAGRVRHRRTGRTVGVNGVRPAARPTR